MIIVTSIVILGSILLLNKSFVQSKTYSNSIQIGDDNLANGSYLISLNSSISSVSLALDRPDIIESTVFVYISTNVPLMYQSSLPVKRIGGLLGESRYNYNYFGADQPVYLISGSTLTYQLIINIQGNKSISCPCKLFLFDNEVDYMNFKNYNPFTSSDVSSCLMESNSTWTFDVTQASSYYIGLEIEKGYEVTSDVSIERAYYDSNGLQSPNDCSHPLTFNDPSCTVRLCSIIYCDRITKYLLLVSKNTNEVSYSFVTSEIQGKLNMTIFIINFLILFITVVVLILIPYCTFRCIRRITNTLKKVNSSSINA